MCLQQHQHRHHYQHHHCPSRAFDQWRTPQDVGTDIAPQTVVDKWVSFGEAAWYICWPKRYEKNENPWPWLLEQVYSCGRCYTDNQRNASPTLCALSWPSSLAVQAYRRKKSPELHGTNTAAVVYMLELKLLVPSARTLAGAACVATEEDALTFRSWSGNIYH